MNVELYVTVPTTPHAAQDARRLLDQALTRWNWGSEDSRAEARLLVSELVANAVEHGGTAPRISLQLGRSGRRLRISVTDPSPVHPSLCADSDRGCGLRLVQAIAERWASSPHPHGGKTVWCELTALPQPRRAVTSGALAA